MTKFGMGNAASCDPNEYLQVNDYVKTALEEEFCGVLPQALQLGTDSIDYRYDYRCAVLGDPSFSVFLKVEDIPAETMAQEITRLRSLPSAKVTERADCVFIVIGSTDWIPGYLDDDIRDGAHYRVELAKINEADGTITYCAALLTESVTATAAVEQLLTELSS